MQGETPRKRRQENILSYRCCSSRSAEFEEDLTLLSTDILDRFRRDHAKDINLTLRPAYRDLLAKLGDPHKKLPPVFHVAGTNGKGSTCAFLRSFLEAEGYRVHVYTSPHLVRFHERIRVAGSLIEEDELAEILTACEKLCPTGSLSYFEAATAAALTAFARHPADFTILETGLGGRLDATNIIEKPLATLITRLSYDHRDYLGETLGDIAREKAGIMRKDVPCFSAPQPDLESLNSLREAATSIACPLSLGSEDWRVEPHPQGFHYKDATRDLDLPQPALKGQHQLRNAGLALATLSVLPQPLSLNSLRQGVQRVEWPARLQEITSGSLKKLLSSACDLWLDGGHNDSAGEVLAAQCKIWRDQDGISPRPLHLILGMLNTKRPKDFLAPLAPYVTRLKAVTIPDESTSFLADELAAEARLAGIKNTSPAPNLQQALAELSVTDSSRILICGSLYLAGHALRLNNTPS